MKQKGDSLHGYIAIIPLDRTQPPVRLLRSDDRVIGEVVRATRTGEGNPALDHAVLRKNGRPQIL